MYRFMFSCEWRVCLQHVCDSLCGHVCHPHVLVYASTCVNELMSMWSFKRSVCVQHVLLLVNFSPVYFGMAQVSKPGFVDQADTSRKWLSFLLIKPITLAPTYNNTKIKMFWAISDFYYRNLESSLIFCKQLSNCLYFHCELDLKASKLVRKLSFQ